MAKLLTIANRASFLPASKILWDGIKDFIVEMLPAAIAEGPFIGVGRAHPRVDDFRIGAWLMRIVLILGAQKLEEGLSLPEKWFGPLPKKVNLY
jgi:hypothetical protein